MLRLPENIILDDMDGCRVEFNLPAGINRAYVERTAARKRSFGDKRNLAGSFEKYVGVLFIQMRIFSSGFCIINCPRGMES